MISRWEKKKKPIYLYSENMKYIGKFNTTDDFAEYCGCEREYIYHNLKYCKKIRINEKWYVIKREMIKE